MKNLLKKINHSQKDKCSRGQHCVHQIKLVGEKVNNVIAFTYSSLPHLKRLTHLWKWLKSSKKTISADGCSRELSVWINSRTKGSHKKESNGFKKQLLCSKGRHYFTSFPLSNMAGRLAIIFVLDLNKSEYIMASFCSYLPYYQQCFYQVGQKNAPKI